MRNFVFQFIFSFVPLKEILGASVRGGDWAPGEPGVDRIRLQVQGADLRGHAALQTGGMGRQVSDLGVQAVHAREPGHALGRIWQAAFA